MRTMEQKTLEVNRARPQTLEENPARSTAYPPAALLQSFSGLFDLNGVLNEFTRQWHTLHGDLDSILSSIDLRSRELDAQGAMDPPASPPSAKVMDRGEELLSICESTSGKNLRKFVISHLSDVVWLRREVPAAIACAPDPAKLVFGSLGRFYLQGRRAYDRPSDDPMVVFRRACILILEFYVLSGCTSMELEESIEQNAEMAALSWRSRLINEGGLQAASAVDALGLVLFVGSFGIPQVFGCRDLYELLRSSNLKKKADVLRNSAILCQKMPGANSTNVTDIINEMLSKEMNVEAVELICAFELKEKHPPVPLIVSYLQKIAQPAKGQRKEGQSFVKSQREANEKQLEKLKLIVRYCEDYKLDPSQLASFNFNQKIAKLETQISKDDERLKNKRKAQEMSRDQVTSYWRSTANQSHVVTPHFGKQLLEVQTASVPNSENYYNSLYQRNTLGDELGVHSGSSLTGIIGNGVTNLTNTDSGTRVNSLTGIAHLSGAGKEVAVAATAGNSTAFTEGNTSHQFANYNGGFYGPHGNGTHEERALRQNLLVPARSEAWMDPTAPVGQNAYNSQALSARYATRSSGASLYHFADDVLERESYYANRILSNPTSSVPNQSYYPSYIS
ncbi:protein FRIGIDA-like isoform X1 [Zingiber officinale]|uniref:protein FRIGIDA-like isoform X1 n=1 Tax=Zingiber officinale TaxID=94328 RepID=UPI001C4CCF09|nr:protein FRIGIDA-like isoform X1 [Zingiber officinale]